MKAVVTGLAWFDEHDLPDGTTDHYSYPNPHEPTMVFETFVKAQGRIGIPYGDKEKLHRLIPDVEIEDRRINQKVSKVISLTGLQLRPYQEVALQEVLEFFKSGGTTLNLAGSPGSGKSILIAAILAELGIKTLLIAHMSMLTKQLHQEISEATNADITTLDAKNLELHDVNIATSQFISKRPQLWNDIKHNISLIIVDESETAASLTTLRILQRAHAKYRIFVSATFSRSMDNRTEALTDVAGQHMVTLERPDLLVPKIMMVSCDEVYPRFTSKHRFVKDKHRFFETESIIDKAVFIAEKSLAKDRQVLIATDIISMQTRLAEILAPYGVGILNGKTSRKERSKVLDDFNSGTIQVIIGAAVLNAGLSIPRVSTIIRVSFTSGKEKNVQLVGRALRDFPDKDGAFVFDLVFTGQNPSKRLLGYKEAGYSVTKHTWDTIKKKL